MKFLQVTILSVLGCMANEARPASLYIHNVTIVDGSGNAPFKGAVRVTGDRIVAVGELEPKPTDVKIDGHGKVLAPGFIDTHSHHDEGMMEHEDLLPVLSQGITTIVVGQDGESNYPLQHFFKKLEQRAPAVNVASYVGHGTLRQMVMGDEVDRIATPGEVEKMKDLLRQEMAAGGLGLSTGLEYEPGTYANTSELIGLAKVAAEYKGRYISHLRSEDRGFWDAVDEILMIGKEADIPVQISHLKLAMKSLWHQADKLLNHLDHARNDGINVTADVYPYTYWQSSMTVLFPERDFHNEDVAEFVVTELAPAESMIIARFDAKPQLVGKTLVEVANQKQTSAPKTLINLINLAQQYESQHGKNSESIIATSMHEDDVKKLLTWKHSNLSSDGYLTEMHPRGRGAFPRFLGQFVRKGQLMSLAMGVRKVSALAAQHMGFKERGLIKAGMIADLVLFSPDKIIDKATPTDPFAVSQGIDKVFVSGALVYESGTATGRTPGRVLRAQDEINSP